MHSCRWLYADLDVRQIIYKVKYAFLHIYCCALPLDPHMVVQRESVYEICDVIILPTDFLLFYPLPILQCIGKGSNAISSTGFLRRRALLSIISNIVQRNR